MKTICINHCLNGHSPFIVNVNQWGQCVYEMYRQTYPEWTIARSGIGHNLKRCVRFECFVIWYFLSSIVVSMFLVWSKQFDQMNNVCASFKNDDGDDERMITTVAWFGSYFLSASFLLDEQSSFQSLHHRNAWFFFVF